MGALFDLDQDYENEEQTQRRNFKHFAKLDVDYTFFNGNEHADIHNVDGRDMLVIMDKDDIRDHSAHWEAGAKQNYDTGLYNLHGVLYIRKEDYGTKPKQGKLLTLDKKITYAIRKCDEECGVYRLTVERIRQG